MEDDYSGGGLYIVWLSDKDYYGGRTNNFRRRFRDHRKRLESGKHKNPRMQNVYNIYGKFDAIVLTRLDTLEEQIIAEQSWLDNNVGERNCLNLDKCASRTTEEGRFNISKAQKGKTISAETREKIAEANRGSKRTEEQKQRMSKAQKGLRWTDEQRAAQSQRVLDRHEKHSEETLEKMRVASTGKKHTEEAKQRMSVIQKELANNRLYSDDTRKKMSESQIGRWTDETRRVAAEKSKAIYEANKASGALKLVSDKGGNRMKGKNLPDEWKESLSKGSQARWTDEAKAEASARSIARNDEKRRLGIPFRSEESKLKQSEKMKETLRLKKLAKSSASLQQIPTIEPDKEEP